jgi:hypothetical protein
MNIWLAQPAIPAEMTITDVFTITRGNSEVDRYVAVSLPPEVGGGSAIWMFQRWTDLSRYAVGSTAEIVWHRGYFGSPWCEYKDVRFPGVRSELNQRERSGTATSAEGQFSPNSHVKQTITSWGIPLKEVADLHELPRPVRP